MSDLTSNPVANFEKWKADLIELGGYENELVQVPAGAVREIIEAGLRLQSELAEARRDAARWQFCFMHAFPVRNQTQSGYRAWVVDIGHEICYGATPTQAVDAAIAALKEQQP